MKNAKAIPALFASISWQNIASKNIFYIMGVHMLNNTIAKKNVALALKEKLDIDSIDANMPEIDGSLHLDDDLSFDEADVQELKALIAMHALNDDHDIDVQLLNFNEGASLDTVVADVYELLTTND